MDTVMSKFNILANIRAARAEYDAIVKSQLDTVARLFRIGVLANEAIGAESVMVGEDGESFVVKSGNSYSKASGIPQSSVSRGQRIVEKFSSESAARKAFNDSDFTSVQAWVGSFGEGESDKAQVDPVTRELNRISKLSTKEQRILLAKLAKQLGKTVA